VQERVLGRKHPTTVNLIANLGVNYRDAKRFAEAIPLLVEAYEASKDQPGTEWIAAELLEADFLAADSVGTVATSRIVALVRNVIAFAPQASPQLAGRLAEVSLFLLGRGRWDEAEPLLRQCLALREKEMPDDWRTFNTRALLGGALLGQKRSAEAEPLLLAGYRGMKEREASIPPPGRPRMTEALERLVRLYEATGQAAEAAAWRATLEAARTTESGPATRESNR
jgi:hypothetical protein